MKKIILFSLLLLTCMFALSQEYCDKKNSHDANFVKEFQKEFTVTVTVDSLFLGDKKYKVGFSHTEKFTDESPLIKINDSIAVKVSVARVVLNGEKKYLYSYDFYRKTDCWNKIDFSESWSTFKPGNSVLAALSMGVQGDSGYFRFEGDISIK